VNVKRFAFALVFAVVSIAASSTPASTETIKLKFGYVQPVGAPNDRAAKSFASKVDKYSRGRIVVETYPAGQLGGERDIIEGLRLGSLQLYIGSTSVASQFVPEFSLFEMPYLISDFPHAQRIWEQVLSAHIEPKSEKVGFRVLGIYDGGERGVGTGKKVTKLGDLKGLRIRTMESKISIESYKALGAIATPIPFPDLVPALTQGVVDGADYAVQTYLQAKVYQVAPYFVHLGMARMPGIMAISFALWQKLSPDLQQAVQKAATEALTEESQALEAFIKQQEIAAKESKFPFSYLSPDLAGARDASKSVYTQFEKNVGGREIIQRVLAVK
jgi:TRAP-type transport system periplasmic protein